MAIININVIADSVCPFCYAASKQITAAVSAYKQKYPTSNDSFAISWHPFYLNADPPKPSIPKEQYFTTKFGPEMLDRIYGGQEAMGKEHGINFKRGGKVGDTRDSHRLIYLAGKKSGAAVQQKVVNDVFSAYFEKEQDISEQDVLLDIAVGAGIDKVEAKKWLEDGEAGKEVDEEAAKARAEGVKSTPNVKVGDQDMGSNRDVESFLAAFEKVKAA